jgi:hypothetical protein
MKDFMGNNEEQNLLVVVIIIVVFVWFKAVRACFLLFIA